MESSCKPPAASRSAWSRATSSALTGGSSPSTTWTSERITSSRRILVGTSADNPIEYTEGVPLINNAFYRVDGVIKVYMDGWVDWEG